MKLEKLTGPEVGDFRWKQYSVLREDLIEGVPIVDAPPGRKMAVLMGALLPRSAIVRW